MKGILAFLLGIVVVLLLIGAGVAFFSIHDDSDSGNVVNKVKEVVSSDEPGNVVSEVIKPNGQNGEGSYREVKYDDGGFRQFDTKTGELIGSSYESDQAKLPSME